MWKSVSLKGFFSEVFYAENTYIKTMSEEERHIPDDLKKELLEKTKKSGTLDVEERAAMLEGKIPTKPKDEDEE